MPEKQKNDVSLTTAIPDTFPDSANFPLGATAEKLAVPHVAATSQVPQFDNCLAQVRLGIASGLYVAVRSKHPPTAAHSLRVALFCSSWSYQLKLVDTQRDVLEVAALLHDVGKIGVPDHLLSKPGPLTADEADMVRKYRQHGIEILSACCCNSEIIESVRLAANRYDGGTTDNPGPTGADLPLAARMIAIVDAYDSMIHEQVYRRPMSQERAVAELFSHAGSQFDPHLVEKFSRLQLLGKIESYQNVVRRWLHDLNPTESQHYWGAGPLQQRRGIANESESLFHDKMLDNTLHGVIYVDAGRKIIRWNTAAERITGIQATTVANTQWDIDNFRFWGGDRKRITKDLCPVQRAIQSKCQTLQRVVVRRVDRDLSLDLHVFPVVDERNMCQGAAILLRDATSETSLEQTVHDLHLQAARDPLTKAANRAEFDRVLNNQVKRFQESAISSSLIICDIDHFKSVNDTFGHPAGDSVLIGFSDLLHSICRPEDLVARYGGEEFAVVCPDCDIAAATMRAERIRAEIAAVHFTELGSRRITVSFGVTQVQNGDSPETVVRRADRALYQAKEFGRNRVVQLGSADDKPSQEGIPETGNWLSWLSGIPSGNAVIERRLLAQVPIDLAVEKLRGFVADHSAEIISVTENHLVLSVDSRHVPLQRRNSDRATTMILDVQLESLQPDDSGSVAGLQTRMHVAIRSKRSRDRRSEITIERATQLLRSLKAYLMAHEELTA